MCKESVFHICSYSRQHSYRYLYMFSAMAGAVRAVLRQVDERIEGAKNDEKKLEEIPLSDEEEEKAEAERREAEAEEEEEAAKEEVGKDKTKRIPTVLRDGSSRHLAPKRREPTEFERKQRLVRFPSTFTQLYSSKIEQSLCGVMWCSKQQTMSSNSSKQSKQLEELLHWLLVLTNELTCDNLVFLFVGDR